MRLSRKIMIGTWKKQDIKAAQKRILDMLENKIQEPVLDLACGPGFILSNLQKFPAVIANDFSKPMVELAIKKVGNKVIFYNFNAENITLDTKFKNRSLLQFILLY